MTLHGVEMEGKYNFSSPTREREVLVVLAHFDAEFEIYAKFDVFEARFHNFWRLFFQVLKLQKT